MSQYICQQKQLLNNFWWCFPSTDPAHPVVQQVAEEVLPEALNEEFAPEKRRRIHPDDSTKLQIIFLYGGKYSFRQIGKNLGCHHTVVARVIKKWEQDQTIERKTGSGRPRKTSPQTDRFIVRSVMANRFTSLADLKENPLLATLSDATVRRRITESGELKSYWAARKPFLRSINKRKRLAWCLARRHWTKEQWEQFLWTDESPFVLRFKAKRRVWRRHNERYKMECVSNTLKHDVNINVWACFSAHGVGSIRLVEGILDQYLYMEILENEMLPSAENLFGNGEWTFQQDNDPKHTAINTRNWFITHEVPLSEWPAQSPDLNPIENLWSIVDQRCAKRAPNNSRELFKIIESEWYRLEPDLLKHLVHSMPRRIEACIAAEGDLTKY
jgi:DNA-binding Lrp family transcriptional regulator